MKSGLIKSDEVYICDNVLEWEVYIDYVEDNASNTIVIRRDHHGLLTDIKVLPYEDK